MINGRLNYLSRIYICCSSLHRPTEGTIFSTKMNFSFLICWIRGRYNNLKQRWGGGCCYSWFVWSTVVRISGRIYVFLSFWPYFVEIQRSSRSTSYTTLLHPFIHIQNSLQYQIIYLCNCFLHYWIHVHFLYIYFNC